MPYTLLRVTEVGVVLRDYHARRFEREGGAAARDALLRRARAASPGVWAVSGDARSLRAELRAGSRLRDGMPARTTPSPALDRAGRFGKPCSPSAYDSVRREGVATLLTSADGSEILEACCAAVVGWDGERIVCPPRDRPRVWSTAEAAIRDHLPVREAAIAASCDALLLVNAVKGTCALAEPRSRSFPPEIRQAIEALFARLTRRA